MALPQHQPQLPGGGRRRAGQGRAGRGWRGPTHRELMSPGTILGTQEEPTQMMDSLVQLQVAGQRANRLTCALGGMRHAALSSSNPSAPPPLRSAMPGPPVPARARTPAAATAPRRALGPGAAADAGVASPIGRRRCWRGRGRRGCGRPSRSRAACWPPPPLGAPPPAPGLLGGRRTRLTRAGLTSAPAPAAGRDQ